MVPLGTPACIDCRDDWSLLISIYCILWLWYSFGRSFAVPRISYCLSLQRRIEWLMSKAFRKSILYMPTTYCPALEACKIVSFRARSAVWVNLCFLKPCCKLFRNFQTVKYEYILMYISAKLLPAKTSLLLWEFWKTFCDNFCREMKFDSFHHKNWNQNFKKRTFRTFPRHPKCASIIIHWPTSLGGCTSCCVHVIVLHVHTATNAELAPRRSLLETVPLFWGIC